MSCPSSTIDDIFAAKATPAAAHDLYAHLDTCAACRAHYERELFLQSLLPPDRRTTPETRIRATLPLTKVATHARWRRVTTVVAVLAAAACVLLAFRHRPAGDDEFHARGVATTGPAFEVYRLHPGGVPERAPTVIDRSDELAFAYTNPDGKKYLAVFAVDDTRQVYWYYPAWTNAAETPSSIPIPSSLALVELGEGIRHDFAGRTARLYAVWSDAPLTTAAIEARLRQSPPLAERLDWPGTEERSRIVELR